MKTTTVGNRRSAPLRSSELRILVVDDEGATRAGVAALIADQDDGRCQILLAANQVEALELDRRYEPHIVVLDMDLAGQDGLALLPHFLPHARVIVLTSEVAPQARARAMALGASAFIDKCAPAAVLANCVAALADGAG